MASERDKASEKKPYKPSCLDELMFLLAILAIAALMTYEYWLTKQ